MARGGYRSGAGAKGSWQSGSTRTIRVPESLADQLLRIARYLDQGGLFDPDTESDTDTDTESNRDLLGEIDLLILGLDKGGENQLGIDSRDKAACRRGFGALRDYLSDPDLFSALKNPHPNCGIIQSNQPF